MSAISKKLHRRYEKARKKMKSDTVLGSTATATATSCIADSRSRPSSVPLKTLHLTAQILDRLSKKEIDNED